MRNQIETNRKCPDCSNNLIWLTKVKKYNCEYCGWDGEIMDVEVHEGLMELLNPDLPRKIIKKK